MRYNAKERTLLLCVIMFTQLAIAPVLTYPKFASVEVKPGGQFKGGNGGVMHFQKSQLHDVQSAIAQAAISACDIEDVSQKLAMRRAQQYGWPGFVDDLVAFSSPNGVHGASRIDAILSDDDLNHKRIEPYLHYFLAIDDKLTKVADVQRKARLCTFNGNANYGEFKGYIEAYFGSRLKDENTESVHGYTTTTWTLTPPGITHRSRQQSVSIKLSGALDPVMPTSLGYAYTVAEPLDD